MRHLDDFEVNDVYDLGSICIGAAEIIGFARRFDPQPRHLKGSLASGWHVAVLFMRMYVTAVLADVAAESSPGIDELRWLRPVRDGDVLTGRVTVLQIGRSLSRPDCGIIRQRGELRDHRDRPVFSMVFYGLIRRGDLG